jgi:hypothetical protein
LMTSHEERIVRRMIAIYKALGIDGYVTFSSKSAAEVIGASRPTAMKAFRGLVEMGIISPVREGHFKNRHQPSRWKLNMFPFDGEPATHDYLTDRERRGIRRNRKRREVTITLDAAELNRWERHPEASVSM